MEWPLRFDLPLQPESLARWLYARDGRMAMLPATEDVPLSYLVFLRAQPRLGVSFHELLDRDPDRGLYGGVTYRRLGALAVGSTLQAASEIVSRESVEAAAGRLTVTTLTTTYSCGGKACATESVRMIDLPPGPAGPPPPQAARSPVHPPIATLAPITRKQVAWLTVETGDTNSLHLDARYAATRGFPDVVVPATLLSALIERELTAFARSPLADFSVRYHAPTYPEEALQLFASGDSGSIAFEVFAGSGLRASGKARPGDSR